MSFAVTVKLICAFVFAYAKTGFSHDEAHMVVIFSSPVQSTGRAIVVTLASALELPFPSRHF